MTPECLGSSHYGQNNASGAQSPSIEATVTLETGIVYLLSPGGEQVLSLYGERETIQRRFPRPFFGQLPLSVGLDTRSPEAGDDTLVHASAPSLHNARPIPSSAEGPLPDRRPTFLSSLVPGHFSVCTSCFGRMD